VTNLIKNKKPPSGMVLKWSRGDTVLLPDFAALVNQRTGTWRFPIV